MSVAERQQQAEPGVTRADQWGRRVSLCVGLLLLALLALLLLVQLPFGLADNGDFSRIMIWFTSRPVGFAQNWPAAGTEAWDRRFFNYYLPDWRLDFPGGSKVRSSVLLLWWPGVWLNRLLYDDLLKIGVMSLPARGIILLIVLGLFSWLERFGGGLRQRLLLYGVVGLPLVLLVSTTDYLILLNSFYQESGSLVFLLLFVLALLYLRRARTNLWAYGAALAALALLAAAKVSNVYWPLIGVLMIAAMAPLPRRRRLALVGASFACAALLVFGAYRLTKDANDQRHLAFHGLFYGALTLSDRPQAQVQALGLPYDPACVGVPAFVGEGPRCFALYDDPQLRRKTLAVFMREPLIVPRMLQFVASQMQVTRLDYLGNRPIADGEQGPPPAVLRLWSAAKERVFPRGDALLIVLLLYAVVAAWSLREDSIRADFAFVGLIASIACVADMAIAFLGDGRQELIKHLLLANMLFDVASIASVGVAVLWIAASVRARLPVLARAPVTRMSRGD